MADRHRPVPHTGTVTGTTRTDDAADRCRGDGTDTTLRPRDTGGGTAGFTGGVERTLDIDGRQANA